MGRVTGKRSEVRAKLLTPAMLPIDCVAMGKLINLSVPVSSQVKWGYNSTYLMRDFVRMSTVPVL